MKETCMAVDFHCHILPCLDDGSRDAEMSRAMLDEMASQGVSSAVATPHFYPDRFDLGAFLEKRRQSLELLGTVYDPASHPKLYLGAEVAYFHGISHSDRIRSLCVEGTRYMLIEMPFSRWQKDVIEEVVNMEEELGIVPILAHIERYESYQKGSTLPFLIENGVLIQSNASHFLEKKSKKQALSMLKKGKIHLLGSDCHNLTDRRPTLGAAAEELLAAGYGDRLEEMYELGLRLLSDAKPAL